MKLLLLSLVACTSVFAHYVPPPELRATLSPYWMEFEETYHKFYWDPNEYIERYAIFEANMQQYREHNQAYEHGFETYKQGMNYYSDMWPEEVAFWYTGLQNYTFVDEGNPMTPPPKDAPLPPSVDWRTEGLVSDVKFQGKCRSGWAFAAVGAVEGQYAKQPGKNGTSLSTQQVVDCSGPEGDHGCVGGIMTQAFEYMTSVKGLETDATYGYTKENSTCEYDESEVVASVAGYVNVTWGPNPGNEGVVRAALANIGPLAVGINASPMGFISYKEGVYYDVECTSDTLTHGMLLVGYGTTEKGLDYWLVKNSWGGSVDWGDNGYMKLARNANNLCGITSMVSYPVLK